MNSGINISRKLQLALGMGALMAFTVVGLGDENKAVTLRGISLSAKQELEQVNRALNELREQVSAEKVPLAQKLATLEEQLSGRKREMDQLQRTADSGTLDIAAFKAEEKARQDELAYVGNILDEYARSYETKATVSELQAVGELLTAAKQATENTTLSQDDRLARQTVFAETTCGRLKDAIGGVVFPGSAVGVDGNVEAGNFAIFGPVALFASSNGPLAGVVIPQPGSTKPLIRALSGDMQAGLAALVRTGKGTLPIDPSRGGALKAMVKKFDITEVFKKGGPIMWPLLVAASLSVLTVIERVFFLVMEGRKRDYRRLEQFFDLVTKGESQKAIALAGPSKFFLLRALVYAMQHSEHSISNALLYSQSLEMKRYRRGIPILDTVITLAPLLGLLGTVTGMMNSFSLIGGDLSSPGAITGGIAEALIATAFGLSIAITSLIPFNILNSRLEEAQHEMDSAATQLELLVNRPASVVEAVRRGH